MKSSVVRAFGLFATVLVAGAAGAQSTQAVEWKVSEGGNGHWYQVIFFTSGTLWDQAKATAESLGGHLACITSANEQAFVEPLLLLAKDSSDCYPVVMIGLSKRQGLPWTWVDGAPLDFQNWNCGEPYDPDYPEGKAVGYSPAGCEPLCVPHLRWDDYGRNYSGAAHAAAMVEWGADCNNDGIVDYGQIKNGQLDDDNNDGIPDACQYTVTGVIPVSGASSGGTVITVKGTNFPENPTVPVGGSPATNVVRVSPTRLTAVTPAGLPGMTSVTVGNWVQPNAFYYRPECGSDLDQDGEVTAADIAIVLLDFGPCYVTATSPQADDSKPFMLQEQPAPETPQSR